MPPVSCDQLQSEGALTKISLVVYTALGIDSDNQYPEVNNVKLTTGRRALPHLTSGCLRHLVKCPSTPINRRDFISPSVGFWNIIRALKPQEILSVGNSC